MTQQHVYTLAIPTLLYKRKRPIHHTQAWIFTAMQKHFRLFTELCLHEPPRAHGKPSIQSFNFFSPHFWFIRWYGMEIHSYQFFSFHPLRDVNFKKVGKESVLFRISYYHVTLIDQFNLNSNNKFLVFDQRIKNWQRAFQISS